MTPAPACTIAVFGAVGDLTKTLLMPAVYDLAVSGLLDPGTKIVGLDHNERDTGGWRSEMSDALDAFAKRQGPDASGKPQKADVRARVLGSLDYVKFDFTSEADYRALARRFSGAANILFYLAVAPRFFEQIVEGVSAVGLLDERSGSFRRVIVEKPFGRDAESARKLNESLTSLAAESQLFRIDHFLGKEAVQGISALRFANGLFEPVFNRDAIASVQITAAETVGINDRGAFYEGTGALRDMMPNHLFSLLTLVAMDRPRSFEANVVRDAKAKLLGDIKPLGVESAARGQYAAGTVAGEPAKAYRQEDNVDPGSRIETYAALDVRVENDRWRGVPFYLRTGKRMSAHVTTIALTLRTNDGPLESESAAPDLLLLGIDPQRGLTQRFWAKRPGVDLSLGRASMGFTYEQTFDEPPNVGYETLLYHVLTGDALLFQRSDMIELEWDAVDGVLAGWEKRADGPELYAAGTDGPACADALLSRNGDAWLAVAPLGTLGT